MASSSAEKRPLPPPPPPSAQADFPLNAPASLPKRPRLGEGVTAASAGGGDWAEVIAELQPAIVALKVTTVRSFEEDPAATALGTGFVVDKDRGLILTNRHITGVGPVRATATFDRHEELEIEVLYRDPVHDFGFFRYDPARLRLTRCAEVRLDPDGLKVGAEIRVIGNDAGEKLQILSGTIARVDRNVPEFNTVYNDENTFYAGAGAGTSGGSSGSPVLNKEGRAVALNAAGQEGAASSYFLPLDRVQYAFEKLRHNQLVPRGTCLAAFLFKPFDELIRVGLPPRCEVEVRVACPDATGLLIVDSILCEQELLKPGDILLRLEDTICTDFVHFEDVLDTKVGATARMHVCRGGHELTFEVPVMDLHALIPRSFVELGLDTLHALGYHAAKRVHLPLDSGMYLAKVGYVFSSLGCQKGALITAIGKTPTPTPEAFVKALADIPHRQYFQVSWYELSDFRRDRTLKTGFAKMSRAWFPLKIWTCESSRGSTEHWVQRDLPVPALVPPAPTATAAALGCFSSKGGFSGGDKLVRKLRPSLVTLRFRTDRRFCTEANYSGFAEGAGLLVDAEQGLVLTDRHSAPQSLGDIEATLAGAVTVDAEVLFVHPLHNLAIVRCEPVAYQALRRAKVPIEAAKLATGARAGLRPGERLHWVGFDNQGNSFSAKVTVAAVYLPSGKDEFPLWDTPRFRERNLEIAVLADTPEDARGGVLCDASGTIRALFAAFDWQQDGHGHKEETTEAFGIPVNIFAALVEAVRKKKPLDVRSLDVEVNAMDVAKLVRGAQAKALPKAWLQAVGRRSGRHGQAARALRVHRVLPSGAADGLLRPGDIILSIGEQTITCCLDIEVALASQPAAPAASKGRQRGSGPKGKAQASSAEPGPMSIKVLRDGAEVQVAVTPSWQGSQDDARLVMWAGLVLRRTPRSLLERCSRHVAKLALAESGGGVFVQSVQGGSPADMRELMAHCFLLELNGQPIRELQDVLVALAFRAPSPTPAPGASNEDLEAGGAPAGERPWVRLRMMDPFGQEHVRALQCDPLFFPTFDLQRVETGRWQCTQHC